MCDIHAHRDFESIATNFFQIVPYFMVWPHRGILRGPGHQPCHKSLKLPGSRCVGTLWGWRFIPQLDSNSRDTCKRDNLSARKICFDVKWREQKWTLYCIHTRTNDRTKTIISLSLDVCLLMMSHIALLSQWDITCLLHILIPKICNARTIEYNSKKSNIATELEVSPQTIACQKLQNRQVLMHQYTAEYHQKSVSVI